MNPNDAISAINDGSFRSWDIQKLHEGIAALNKGSSPQQAQLFNGLIATLQAEIAARERADEMKQAAIHNQKILSELGEHNTTARKAVCWAQIAAGTAFAAFLVALADFVVRLFKK